MLKNKRFRSKVLKILLLVSLIPLFIISATSLFITIKTRQQNIQELQNLAIENAMDKITKYINEQSEGFHLVVGGSLNEGGRSIKDLKSVDPNNLLFLIRGVKQTAKDCQKIQFIDSRGDVLVQIGQDGNVDLKKYFGDAEIRHTDINVNRREAITGNLAQSKLFKQAYSSGKNYFGQLEYVQNSPTIKLASQIENQDNQIIGVIAAELNTDSLDRMLGKIKLGNTGYLYLLDKSGNVITSSNPLVARTGDNIYHIPMIRDVIEYGAYQNDFQTYSNQLNQDVIFSSEPIPELGWFVISEWPSDDAYKVIKNILLISLSIMLFSALLAIILGVYFTKQVVKPIEILNKGAREISKGNLNYRIYIKTQDEFENLAVNFNKMIKVLKENQKLRDEFVFIAAHELRTPVTAIRGYLSMIFEKTFGKVPPGIENILKTVNKSNDRLVQLVQDLLEVARSDAGKMKLELSPVSLDDSIASTINELDSLAKEKGLKVVYDKPKNEIVVNADQYKLKEVLVNLVGNAIKYTLTPSDINVTHEFKGDYVVTHIKDHGIGMSPNEVKKLFSKFYRAQNENTKGIEGTGLGLFICKEIIERMGGKIWVESKPGQGSTFSFSLKKIK